MPGDLDKIDQLLADQEKAIRDAFIAFLAASGSSTVTAEIMRLLERRDFEAAQEIIDSYVERMADVIPRAFAAVGDFTTTELSEELAANAPEIVTGISFDPSHPRAAQIVRDHRLRFVRDFTAEQRRSTTQAITRALNDGKGAIETARAFRDSIGLTSAQEGWVNSYRAQLEARSKTALTRALRDRRFDGKVGDAIANSKPLTDNQIDTMVSRYRTNALQMRAETIARTEGLQATSEARDESVDQMLATTGLSPDRLIDIWNSTRDTRTRDWHRTMNGQQQPHGTPFKDGLGNTLRYPGDPNAPANTRINCRCNKTFSIAPLP